MPRNEEEGYTPKVVTGFQVRYASADDEFITYQTFQPVDGNHYKVLDFQPVVFIPLPEFRIDTSTPESPKVVRDGIAFQLNDAISRAFVRVATRWERPIPQENAG